MKLDRFFSCEHVPASQIQKVLGLLPEGSSITIEEAQRGFIESIRAVMQRAASPADQTCTITVPYTEMVDALRMFLKDRGIVATGPVFTAICELAKSVETSMLYQQGIEATAIRTARNGAALTAYNQGKYSGVANTARLHWWD